MAPASKFTLGLIYDNVGSYTTMFCKLSYFSYDNVTPVIYNSKTVFDLIGTLDLSNSTNFTLGIKNMFNIYPTQQIASDDTDSGGYFDAVQMGFGGTYFYARLGFSF